MGIAGIICEFNPFHNGHKYLIDSVRRELSPSAVVCVMSGAFVQRGQPSITDKFQRAKTAIDCGADLVLELPVMYAASAAQEFASGAVMLIKGLGCVEQLAFGCETSDFSHFQCAAEYLLDDNESVSQIIKKELSEGSNYASVISAAINEVLPAISKEFLGTPNNLLGLEYAKANKKYDAGLKLKPILRLEEDRAGEGVFGKILSASEIRKMIGAGDAGYADYLPEPSSSSLTHGQRFDAAAQDRLFAIIRYLIISKTPAELKRIYDVTEGLENRLKEAVIQAESIDDLILRTKSKRYTYARISRILMHLLLGLTKKDYISPALAPLYARPLAFNETGTAVLKTIKKQGSIPVLTNLNSCIAKEMPEWELLKWDVKASDIYSSLLKRNIYKHSDFVAKPMSSIYN